MDCAKLALAFAASACLPGCIVGTAVDVVTAPVKVAGKAADLATTSQSEADEKRGRELRERDERLGKLDRKRRKSNDDCLNGDNEACADRAEIDAEIEALLATPGRMIGEN